LGFSVRHYLEPSPVFRSPTDWIGSAAIRNENRGLNEICLR
jgi:hypothetical protein